MASAAEQRCFMATGFCLQGRFLTYWRANGGLAVFGYPLSDEAPGKLLDHQVHQVQYFERARFELHPESASPSDVLLGQLGRYYHAPDAPAQPRADASYVAATSHNLGGDFLAYWRQHGGLAAFGYPLTEEQQQPTSLTTSVTVQYFERVRLEYHPEAAGTPYAVQPARLGAQLLAEREDRGGPGVPPRQDCSRQTSRPSRNRTRASSRQITGPRIPVRNAGRRGRRPIPALPHRCRRTKTSSQ
jgi:hypothetical protein